MVVYRLMQDEFPKCPICSSTENYELSGIVGKYAQCRGCKAKWQLSIKNEKILSLRLHELPKDGSGLYRMTDAKAPLFTLIGMTLPTDSWKNLKLEKEIDWDLLSRSVSSDALKAAITEKGEKLLHQWSGARGIPGVKVVKGNTVRTLAVEPGILILSNQKLRWLAQRTVSKGFLKKDTTLLVVYEIPLLDIQGISGQTGDSSNWQMSKNISVVDKNGENSFGLQYAFLELFKPMVENAIEIRRKEIDAEKKRE